MIVHRAGRPVRAGGVLLVPLERMRLAGTAAGGSVQGFAGIEPAGVAVLSPRGLVILDETGSPERIFPILDEFDGLRAALGSQSFPGAETSS